MFPALWPYITILGTGSGGFWGDFYSTGGESKHEWSGHLKPWWACASSLWPVSGKCTFLPCRKQSSGHRSNVRYNTDKVEGGGEARVGDEQPLAGLKELKRFWAMPAAECKLCFGKDLLEVASGGKKIPYVFLHPCLWLPSQHCPINEERMVLARFFSTCVLTNLLTHACSIHLMTTP